MKDLDAILGLDATRAYESELIRGAIEREQCYVVSEADDILGFMIFNYHFYQHGFIELLYIRESSRGAGIGSSLVDYAAQLCETEKLFTSTQQSNIPMQILLQSNSFEATGIIHNLEENDPEIVYFKQVK
ncbi:MAG: GNAT family N-acetyltransferase [Cyanothece sp. SIO1E1]|nr:GNAT family N-acetyltransferase [Cyanothece sp. SIO1E1]